jgi:hypothetical protein
MARGPLRKQTCCIDTMYSVLVLNELKQNVPLVKSSLLLNTQYITAINS